MKTVKFIEGFCLSTKGVSETFKNEEKESRLGASLLGKLLAGKYLIRAYEGTNKSGQETSRLYSQNGSIETRCI